MIANLIFDLSGYGGSANFTAATETILINELNTLTGVAWYWDPADCKPKSNFYPGVPPVITTQYKVSFVDIDNDSVGFCNAGSLDFTKFNEIDLSSYGGSPTTAVTNNTDIINAFAALSLTVSVVGCKLRISNWNRSSTPTDIEVKKAGCVINNVEMTISDLQVERGSQYEGATLLNPYELFFNLVLLTNTYDIFVDWGDGNTDVFSSPYTPITHTYTPGDYLIACSYTNFLGNTETITMPVKVENNGEVKFQDPIGNESILGFKIGNISFDTSDCSSVTWDLNITTNFGISNPAPGTHILEVVFGGQTTQITAAFGISVLTSFNNILGSFNIPGDNPIIIRSIVNGNVTAEYNGIIVIS